MNRSEIINKIAYSSKLTRHDVVLALDSFVEVVTGALAENEIVHLTGFGTFRVGKRAARKGRNPKTGEEINIPASKSPKFKPGKSLKDAVK